MISECANSSKYDPNITKWVIFYCYVWFVDDQQFFDYAYIRVKSSTYWVIFVRVAILHHMSAYMGHICSFLILTHSI